MIFLAGIASRGFFNKGDTVLLHRDWPANNCILAYILGNVPTQLHDIPTPKIYNSI
jgi:hypothetical protein